MKSISLFVFSFSKKTIVDLFLLDFLFQKEIETIEKYKKEIRKGKSWWFEGKLENYYSPHSVL
jgi:hypothetical protein